MITGLLSELRYRLRALLRRDELDRELDDEVRFHIEHEARKLVAAGAAPDEAMRRARMAFGGVERIKDDARDARGIGVLDALRQDLRYAGRGLRSSPGFSLAVIVTLGLGIGANTAMFSITDRLLFRAPEYVRDADRVHRVYLTARRDGEEQTIRHVAYTRYADLARWTQSFDVAAAVAFREVAIGQADDTREMRAAAVSASFFDLFDAPPALGRYFTAEEDATPVGAPVAVLGHAYWQSHYGGRRDVLGEQVHVNTSRLTIIGVAPPDLGSADGPAPAVIVPVTAMGGARGQSYYQNYNWSWLEVLVRRKPGVSLEAASADLTAAYRRSRQAEDAMNGAAIAAATAGERPTAFAGPIQLARGPNAGPEAKVAQWVSGVALIVLLVACANVANLLLSRAVRRRREIALRLALGVSRTRLAQQLLTETLLLAGLGGALALAIVQWGAAPIRALFMREWTEMPTATDPRTVAFALACTLVVALVTGLAPVLYARRRDVAGALKEGAREGTRHRSGARATLLLFQGALAVVLLVGAGLFVRSLQNVRALRLGYDVDPVLHVQGNMRGVRLTDAEQVALGARLEEAAKAAPGVVDATLGLSAPFWSFEGRGLFVPGVDSLQRLGAFFLQAGSPSYFRTVGTRLLRGRGFTAADREDAVRVVVVSDTMAKLVWPGRDAIGQQIRIGGRDAPFATVVGIAENLRAAEITGRPELWYYVPAAQLGPPDPAMFVRVNGDAREHAEPVRRALQAVMPGASYVTVRPMRDLVGKPMQGWEAGARMFVAFGGLALVLAAVGLYSVIAYAVAQRTHELGVRIALGADRTRVARLVVRQGVGFAVAGVAIGSALALWAGRFVEPLLYGQRAGDWRVYGFVAALLLVVAVVATLGPAWRATRVDPIRALRAD